MKTTINVDVENHLLIAAQEYADRYHLSIAELIESFFEELSQTTSRKNIVEMVRELKKPEIDESKDLKRAYYEEQKSKHGF